MQHWRFTMTAPILLNICQFSEDYGKIPESSGWWKEGTKPLFLTSEDDNPSDPWLTERFPYQHAILLFKSGSAVSTWLSTESPGHITSERQNYRNYRDCILLKGLDLSSIWCWRKRFSTVFNAIDCSPFRANGQVSYTRRSASTPVWQIAQKGKNGYIALKMVGTYRMIGKKFLLFSCQLRLFYSSLHYQVTTSVS